MRLTQNHVRGDQTKSLDCIQMTLLTCESTRGGRNFRGMLPGRVSCEAERLDFSSGMICLPLRHALRSALWADPVMPVAPFCDAFPYSPMVNAPGAGAADELERPARKAFPKASVAFCRSSFDCTPMRMLTICNLRAEAVRLVELTLLVDPGLDDGSAGCAADALGSAENRIASCITPHHCKQTIANNS